MTLIVVRINEQGELYAKMTLTLSVSSFALHAALALAHGRMRVQCFAHFCLIAMGAFINGAFHLARREFGSAVYFELVWGLVFPVAGWGLHRLLRAAKQLDQAAKDALSSSTATAFASSAMPLLYSFGNGVLCIGFKGETHCTARVSVNHAAIHTHNFAECLFSKRNQA